MGIRPKEKAVELIKKFIEHSNECDKKEAVQCALIAVDEILNTDIFSITEAYWKEVKKEINFYNTNTITDKQYKKIIKVIYPK